jgi:hypothetical protein
LRGARSGELLSETIAASGGVAAAARSSIRLVGLTAAFVATILIFVQIPRFPADLDWQDAPSEAIVQHKIFGKDIVFSYGPLASVVTGWYHPATDAFMLSFTILFAAAFFAGCLALSRNSYLMLALPLVLSQVFSRTDCCHPRILDTFFICLPFLFLLLVAQRTTEEAKPGALSSALIIFIGATVALLPLAKVSFSVPVVVCGGLALILVGRRSIAAAAVLAISGFIAIAIAWRLMAQPVGGLFQYFVAQQPIISGYSAAMSSQGRITEVIAYLAGALVIWSTFVVDGYRRFGKPTTAVALGLLIVLFMAFKEGFVRQDLDHAPIAGSTLLVLAFILLLTFRSRLFAVVMIAALCAWATVNSGYMRVDPVDTVSQFASTLSGSWNALRIRVSDPTYFPKRYQDARAEIRRVVPLPPTHGTVDLYPYDLAAIFAAGQKWSPRPVIQSYSAYTSSLAALNRDHLKSPAAPDRIYFSVAPIDQGYPSLDDGASWPELISRYRVAGYFDVDDHDVHHEGSWFPSGYAILERRSEPAPVHIGAPDQKVALLGERVAVPPTDSPIWAKIDVTPTLMGRVVSALFKIPHLHLIVKCANDSMQDFQFVPGEAREGFLLSPTVRNAVDFMALQSTQRDNYFNYFNKCRPVWASITDVHLIRGLEPLWKSTYSISLTKLEFQPDERIVPILFKKPIPISRDLIKGGDCHIDAINATAAQNSPVTLNGNLVSITGWGVVSGREGKPNEKVFVALRSGDGSGGWVEAQKTLRDDINTYFHHRYMGNAGFQALIDVSAMHGQYALNVIQKVGNTFLECEPGRVSIEIR